LYEVIADYIEFTCKMFYDAGIEKSKIFSHIVSVSSSLGGCSTEYPPTDVCINDYCTPGWTMSPKTCNYNLAQLEKELGENGRNEYVNAEGYAHYDDVATCTAYFEESLCGNAKLITVFGYDQSSGTYGYEKSENFYFVKVVKSWLAREIGSDYTWANRPSLVAKLNICKTCGGTLSNGFCLTDNSHYDVPFKDASGFYTIKNAGNLYWFRDQVNNGNNGIFCRLACDISDNIDIYNSDGSLKSENFRAWTPIGVKGSTSSRSVAFNGVFDGRGYTLRNFYNVNGDDYTAFIGYLGSSGVVRNANISSSYFKGAQYVSGLVALNEGTIQNSYSSGAVAGTRYLGGIAGQNEGTIINCYSIGGVTGTGTSSFFNPAYYVGAICGDNGGTVSNCYYLTGSATADGTTQLGIGASRWGSSSDSGTTSKELAQFSSGEVAYLLQSGNGYRIWGQKSNNYGSLPVISGKPMHAVAKYDSDEGYSVGSICDLNNDRSIGASDYQIFVNMALGDSNTEATAEDSVTFARADITGDRVVNVLDVFDALRLYYGHQKLDVFGAGDFNGDGVCTDEDTANIKQTVTNKNFVGKSALMACDFNGDGNADGYDLEEAFGISAVDNYVYFDTKYGDNERHYFDLYIPKDKKTVGIVLMLHGGAWMFGDENEFAGRLEQLAKEGYAGVAVRYRYIDENVNLDDLMDDIEQAMGLVKTIGESHGVEISGFLSTGGSAGGHLALHYAYSRADSSPIPPKAVVSYCGPADLADEYYYYNEDLQSNNGLGDEEYVSMVLGYASGFPHTYETRAQAKDALKFVSPIYYIDENTVPTVINHGVMDNIVPYRNAVSLDAKLTEYGVTHVLNSYPTSGHGLELDAENMAIAEQLFWEYIKKYLDSVNA
ncbi:MAG: prolyl oligopeptidase family serine peptidase, partial [Clostridia bacterium]|nr:prolyl oligopeptidase family serine peptidase [Clostridia bacterium]